MRFIILLLPWLELFSLIQLGIATSALFALAYVFAGLVVGIAIVKRQGRGIVEQLQRAQRPADGGAFIGSRLLQDELVVGLAGLLVAIPGLITDLAALLVIIGPLRRRLLRWMGGTTGESPPPEDSPVSQRPDHPVTLEGSYRRIDEE